MDPGTQHYIDAKTEATRAQNDARFAEILARLERAPTIDELRKLVVTTAITTILTLIAAMIALFAFGADRFSGGMTAASLIYDQSAEARTMAIENAKNIREMREDIDTMREALDAMREDLDTLIRIIGERAQADSL